MTHFSHGVKIKPKLPPKPKVSSEFIASQFPYPKVVEINLFDYVEQHNFADAVKFTDI